MPANQARDIVAAAEAILAAAGVDAPAAAGPGPYSDSALSERVVREVLQGKYVWTAAAGWLRWSGVIWERVPHATVIEAVRGFLHEMVVDLARLAPGSSSVAPALRALNARTVENVTSLARGQVMEDLAAFDQDPDIMVTSSGVVDFRTTQLMAHDSSRLVTRCTRVAYVPGATHLDWITALEAVPSDVREWLQARLGQALTGHPPDDDVLPILQGGGQNGKSAVLGSVLAAMGTYANTVPDSLLLSADGHPTDRMTLRGLRVGVIEELPEGRHLATATIKKIMGTPEISARLMRADFVTFKATHALLVSTNYRPEVSETDHGTWRRLALVNFPYRYLPPSEVLVAETDRHGDPGLRQRLHHNEEQQVAVLAWLVEGARRWYQGGRQLPPTPARVVDDTAGWRQEQDAVLGYATAASADMCAML
ncbi:DNA primase family protein [Streptomyces alfalfae]|uniref:DNA primase family protein n=1 Tax=Streptomyces alfalfae TaxID=1642299 RepID=UPI00281219CB|nr:phage/plasmid primase, P4 family [Streptomyces alfalfae]